jgi:hypothetical protein
METSGEKETRVDYYTNLVKEAYSLYPTTFEAFVKSKEIISLGNDILAEGLSTGFNFVYEGYPMPNRTGTVLYSVYSLRHGHFGAVLAEMESLNIIKENDIGLFVRGTKIVGDYTDPEVKASHLITSGDKRIRTLESVEGTVAFYPDDEVQAIEIAAFLMRQASKIEGGYLDPNIRASYDFKELIGRIGFEDVVANVLRLADGSLIVLRQKSKIEIPEWIDKKIMINEELYQFLASGMVKP